ncbi:MAG: hypothetical protein ACYS0I_01785 [Planctomycetota bacterium]
MNRVQKISWSLVITMSLGLILGLVVTVILYPKFGMPKALCGFGLIFFIGGLGGLSVFFFKKDKGKVTSDERDKLIEKNASLAGLGAVFLYVILLSILPLIILGPDKTIQIPSTWSPALLIGAGFCLAYAQSIAILIQYGWTGKGEEL